MTIYNESVNDAIVFVELKLDYGDIRKSISESIGVTDVVADSHEYSDTATDTITISEVIQAELDGASDSIGLTDEATATTEFNVVATDSVVMAEANTDLWIFNTSSEDELEATVEVFDVDTLTYSTIDVGLRDEASSSGFESVSISEVIPFTELANGWVIPAAGATETASDTLSFTESARFTNETKAKDHLGLSDEATAVISRKADDDLGFTDSATSVVEYNDLQASDSLGLSESNNVLLVEFQVTCRPEFTYSPYVDAYTAEHGTTGFRLQYPATGTVTDELVLKNPNFGNKDRITPNRINNQSRNGELIIFADPAWGDPIESLLYSFSVLTEAEATALSTWFDTYLGQEIRLIDQENRLWRGFMTEVNDPIVHDRRKSYTASFEFEGSKV